MLLNALWTAPEGVGEAVEKSLYQMRAPDAAASFLYGVGIIAIIAFVAAMIASLRVPTRR